MSVRQIHKLENITPGIPPAYLANGLVGLRIGPIPFPNGTALVNGFCGVSPEMGSEEYADAPYPVGVDFHTGSFWLSTRPDLARFRRQEYDFTCGELHSEFDVQEGKCAAHFEVLTFCSRTQPALTLQEDHPHRRWAMQPDLAVAHRPQRVGGPFAAAVDAGGGVEAGLRQHSPLGKPGRY